jgi:hypothetical protein
MGLQNARLLIGVVLFGILMVNLLQSMLVDTKPSNNNKKKKNDDAKDDNEDNDSTKVAAYAESIWFACIIGIIGGFATILTNSMGPMLNVYLLSLKLSPQVFVGTRATFFTGY